MPEVHVLPEFIANQIAAGEVVQRPSSVVKELVENSIDAGATQITIEIRGAGKTSIRILDNGCGMTPNDARLSFERHATSKITSAEDLYSIRTLGFRGEALPSIASVSRVELITRTADALSGFRLELEGGRIVGESETGAPVGTSFTVQQLFYNTPARLKFLKSDSTESTHITTTVTHLALAYPNISFRLMNDGREVLHLPAATDPRERIIGVLGREIDRDLLTLTDEIPEMKLRGYICRPAYTRLNWSHWMVFVNGRFVIHRPLNNAALEGYHGFLMTGRYPVGVLFVEIDPARVDVNVHPTKLEVKFVKERDVQQAVILAIQRTLRQQSVIPEFQSRIESYDNLSGANAFPSDETLKDPLLQSDPRPIQTPGYKPVSSDNSYPGSVATPKFPDYRRMDFYNQVQKTLSDRSVLKDWYMACEPVTGDLLATVQPVSEIPNDPPAGINPESRPFQRPSCAAEAGAEEGLPAEPELFTDMFPELEPLAQLDETYIICRQGTDLMIVDQHAAHERILFERLLPKMESQAPAIQPLLIPVTIDLTPRETSLLEEYQEDIRAMGIDIEPLTRNTWAVRAVPELLDGINVQEIIRDLLDSFTSYADRLATDQLRYQIASVMSCRAAIKAGDSQTQQEWQSLINRLRDCSNPYTCPHGRPTVIRLSKTELEKKFKRTGA